MKKFLIGIYLFMKIGQPKLSERKPDLGSPIKGQLLDLPGEPFTSLKKRGKTIRRISPLPFWRRGIDYPRYLTLHYSLLGLIS